MKQYLDLLRHILENGTVRGDRTGTGTIGVFGAQMRFDLSNGQFPLLTTKKVFTRGIIEELLWFLRGSTNNEELAALNVRIWDGWALTDDVVDERALSNHDRAVLLGKRFNATTALAISRLEEEDRKQPNGGLLFLEQEGIPATVEFVRVPKGELGPIYGKQWRSWQCPDGSTIDQIAELIHNLKTKPYSRRHVVTAWNPADLPDESVSPQENVKNGKQALASCHCLFQFDVMPMSTLERINHHAVRAPDWSPVREMLSTVGAGATLAEYNEAWFNNLAEEAQKSIVQELNALGVPDKKLSCQLYQRSCDYMLGVPFNIASYALLTAMIAQVCNMAVDEFIWTGGNIHVYLNHLEHAKLQLTREPRALPKLRLNPAVKDIDGFTFEDFVISDYDPHPAIKMDVSI